VFLQDYPEYSELDFWQTISNTIVEFNQKHPELAERADKFAMLRPSYTKICLNRVRLFTTSYNDEAERPVPVFLDPIANPVSPETLKTWAEQPRQAKAG
jgi:siderophore synthetase component